MEFLGKDTRERHEPAVASPLVRLVTCSFDLDRRAAHSVALLEHGVPRCRLAIDTNQVVARFGVGAFSSNISDTVVPSLSRRNRRILRRRC